MLLNEMGKSNGEAPEVLQREFIEYYRKQWLSLENSFNEFVEYYRSMEPSINMLVMNEYFWGKTALDEGIIASEFLPWSGQLKNTVLCANFLLIHKEMLSGQRREKIISKVKKLFSPGKDITTDLYHNENRKLLLALMDSGIFESKSISKFDDSPFGKYILFLETQKSMKGSLENKSFIFFGGNIMTTYNKSTYCEEQDNALYDYIYVFGNGQDEKHCEDDTVYSCISTQICRDLVLGTRLKDTENRRFHILESNTVDFDGRSIPKGTTYVIHANYGKPGAIYKKTRRFSSNPEDEKYVWDQIGPFEFYFKFTIGTSYYTLQGINVNPGE